MIFPTLGPDSTIRDALAHLERSPHKLALVTDEYGALLRTISDGDIRRGMLAGENAASPVSSLAGRDPVTASEDCGERTILDLLNDHSVTGVVRVDGAGKPVDIVSRRDIGNDILLSPPHMSGNELDFVHEAFDTNWIAPAGPQTLAFEKELAALTDVPAALALSSGTAALHLAMRAVGVRGGDSVYVSDLTFVASLQPILYENATPVLIDSEPHSWNMSPIALSRKLAEDAENGTLPRAIILVHLYGQPARTRSILSLAEQYGIPLIEDAAESLGAIDDGRPSGSSGEFAALSFNGNKIITTSGGGALLGKDPAKVEQARKLSSQGRDPFEHYQHSEIAYNYRMSNILAGIGRGQLSILDDKLARRRELFACYREGLSDIDGISFQQDNEGSLGNRWLTAITLDPDRIAIHPYVLMKRLRAHGIETRPGWKPMHMQPLCRTFEFAPHSSEEAVSPRLFLQSLCLPSGSGLSDSEQAHVIDLIHSTIEKA